MGGDPSGARKVVERPGDDRTKSNITIIYVLYLVGFVIQVTTLIGVVMAYIYRGEVGDDEVARSHYTFQIRTFWIMLVVAIAGGLLSLILIGWLVLAALAVWYIVRCIKGIQAIQAGRAIADPETWAFG